MQLSRKLDNFSTPPSPRKYSNYRDSIDVFLIEGSTSIDRLSVDLRRAKFRNCGKSIGSCLPRVDRACWTQTERRIERKTASTFTDLRGVDRAGLSQTVTAAPRKIDFWLESSRPPFMSGYAWSRSRGLSIETEIYTLQRFDLLFCRVTFLRWD